jgi:hypothetical protein
MLINTIKQEIMTQMGPKMPLKWVGDFIERKIRKDTNDVLLLLVLLVVVKVLLLKEIIRRSTIRSVAVSAPTHIKLKLLLIKWQVILAKLFKL